MAIPSGRSSHFSSHLGLSSSWYISRRFGGRVSRGQFAGQLQVIQGFSGGKDFVSC
jgi:hypothetical protein